MSNPATLLANLLAGWDVPARRSAEEVRGAEHSSDLEFWRGQGHAVGLLREVEREIAAMEAVGRDVGDLKAALPFWYQAVFAYMTPWRLKEGSPRKVIDPRDLRALRMLGQWIDDREAIPLLLAEQIAEISAVLSEARALVEETSSLKASSRGYLLALIGEAEACLQSLDDTGSATQVRKVTFELSGALFSHAIQVSEQETEQRKRWFNTAGRLAASTTGQVTLAAVGGAVGQLTQMGLS